MADYGAEALVDGYNKLITEGVSSLVTLVGFGSFMVGVKVGAAIAVPVVDLIGNINDIQAKTYRVLWALEAADAYYVYYLKAVEDFKEAPLANYEEMVEASSTFCLLYGNVAEALYKCWDEIQASPWQTFWNFCAGYDVNAAKENHKQVVQFYKNFLKQDCINFYQDFAKPSGEAYVEWGN